jgi:acetyl-CoA acyltransferase
VTVRRAVVVDVLRTPFGRGKDGGALAGMHPVDLLADVLSHVLIRNGLESSVVDDVIAGCTQPVAEQAGNVARHALLAAGFDECVPGFSLDRKCGSFQQAVHVAAQGVLAGAYRLVLACGVEMMSLIPMRTNRIDRDDLGSKLRLRYPDGFVGQGISAELICAKWSLGREELDTFALRSHQRAATARREGKLVGGIRPVCTPAGGVIADDEGIRDNASLDSMSRLQPSFFDVRMQDRFPQIGWNVTAGNSSPTSDGAGVALIADQDFAESLGLRPRAAVTGFAVAGDDPIVMLTGIIPATRRLLDRSGLTVDDVGLFEVNEAFSAVVLAWQKEFAVADDRINIDGGAIAYGHPVGASGSRLLCGLVEGMERRDERYGLMTMCESGGMANATLLERVR